uniref:Beta-lactamase-related domain-containing protein n=1 Tax=viral metagenome TaxID=1070528 RepID=A0A6C0CAG2_9ZZZZ
MKHGNKHKGVKYEFKSMQRQTGGDNIIFIKSNMKRIRYRGVKDGGDYINTIDDDILDENSEFRIGSITKLFMDITILLMQEKNELSVNDKLSKYIKSENPVNNFSEITLLDVMNHKSGMKRFYDDRRTLKHKNATEAMNLFINDPIFEHKKGEFVYSNIGFIILGAVIEKITGINNYHKIIKKYILKPLKMKNTNVGETNVRLYNEHGKFLSEKEFDEIYYAASAGGLYSTIHDMMLFAKNMPTLFEDPNLIKLLSGMGHNDDKVNILTKNGLIHGGLSLIFIEYTPNWEFVDCKIEFETIVR